MNVFFSESNAKTDIEAIKDAGQILFYNDCIDYRFTEACLSRETNYPTGLSLNENYAIAMPHGGAEFVKKDSISVVRMTTPVLFGRMEDAQKKVSVNLAFNLAISKGTNHLLMLRQLMKLFQNAEFLTNCMKLEPQKAAVYIKEKLQENKNA